MPSEPFAERVVPMAGMMVLVLAVQLLSLALMPSLSETEVRVFEDPEGKMNLSLVDQGGGLMVISQFTLLGDCRKGRRPSFANAAEPEKAETLYQYFVSQIKNYATVSTGKFQAKMDVYILNDGPVTFILDSKNRGN